MPEPKTPYPYPCTRPLDDGGNEPHPNMPEYMTWLVQRRIWSGYFNNHTHSWEPCTCGCNGCKLCGYRERDTIHGDDLGTCVHQ